MGYDVHIYIMLQSTNINFMHIDIDVYVYTPCFMHFTCGFGLVEAWLTSQEQALQGASVR